MRKSSGLYVPASAIPKGKATDGLYPDAVVLLENTGYALEAADGTELPLAGLVTKVYPDTEPASDRSGGVAPWNGERPFIDAIAVVRDPEGVPQIIVVSKIPWAKDVQRMTHLHALPGLLRPGPQYRVVTTLEGVE